LLATRTGRLQGQSSGDRAIRGDVPLREEGSENSRNGEKGKAKRITQPTESTKFRISEQIACEPYREREAESKRGPIGEPAERETQTRDGREDDWRVGENLREDEAEQDSMDLGIVEEAALLVPVGEREQTSDGEPGIPVQETDSAIAMNSMLAQSTPCGIATQEPGSEKQKRDPTKSSPKFWERKFNLSRDQ